MCSLLIFRHVEHQVLTVNWRTENQRCWFSLKCGLSDGSGCIQQYVDLWTVNSEYLVNWTGVLLHKQVDLCVDKSLWYMRWSTLECDSWSKHYVYEWRRLWSNYSDSHLIWASLRSHSLDWADRWSSSLTHVLKYSALVFFMCLYVNQCSENTNHFIATR